MNSVDTSLVGNEHLVSSLLYIVPSSSETYDPSHVATEANLFRSYNRDVVFSVASRGTRIATVALVEVNSIANDRLGVLVRDTYPLTLHSRRTVWIKAVSVFERIAMEVSGK